MHLSLKKVRGHNSTGCVQGISYDMEDDDDPMAIAEQERLERQMALEAEAEERVSRNHNFSILCTLLSEASKLITDRTA